MPATNASSASASTWPSDRCRAVGGHLRCAFAYRGCLKLVLPAQQTRETPDASALGTFARNRCIARAACPVNSRTPGCIRPSTRSRKRERPNPACPKLMHRPDPFPKSRSPLFSDFLPFPSNHLARPVPENHTAPQETHGRQALPLTPRPLSPPLPVQQTREAQMHPPLDTEPEASAP